MVSGFVQSSVQVRYAGLQVCRAGLAWPEGIAYGPVLFEDKYTTTPATPAPIAAFRGVNSFDMLMVYGNPEQNFALAQALHSWQQFTKKAVIDFHFVMWKEP